MTGTRPLRLLVSARDTGAAAHMAEIVPSLGAAAGIDVTLAADNPAFSYLRARGLGPRLFTGGSVATRNDSGAAGLRAAARQLLDDVKPDALLVGLSGPGIGIDEALLAEAPALPAYAVQDYPGWVVEGFGVKPRTFFVADAFAAEMTLSRQADAKVVIAGSAKHAAYARLDTQALRKAGRLELGEHTQHVGFYGQPAWFMPGYEQAVTDFAFALSAIDGIDPFYRPHPKETADDRDRMQSIFSHAGLTLRLDPNEDIEQSLCAVDVVVTCFSSCGADQIHLQRQSSAPLGTVLYLFTEDDLRRHHTAHAGSDVPLYATMKLALLADDRNMISQGVRSALDPASSQAMWHRTRDLLPDPMPAGGIILATIREGISGEVNKSHDARKPAVSSPG